MGPADTNIRILTPIQHFLRKQSVLATAAPAFQPTIRRSSPKKPSRYALRKNTKRARVFNAFQVQKA